MNAPKSLALETWDQCQNLLPKSADNLTVPRPDPAPLKKLNTEFPFFPVEQAARDLAWLIENTLAKFEGLGSSSR